MGTSLESRNERRAELKVCMKTILRLPVNCSEAPNEIAPAKRRAPAVCGACGMKARKAERATVEHVVNRGPQNEITDTQYYFCDAPSCDVVYFSNDSAQYFR